MKTKLPMSMVLALLIHYVVISQTNINLDFNKKYQTMDGFGCFQAINDNWSMKYDIGFVDTALNDLGLTISRGSLTYDFEATNDNADPNVTDLTKYNLNGQMAFLMNYWKALKAKAPETKLIISVWTPPVWMKENAHSCDYGDPINTCGGRLKYNMREEYAEMCVAFVKKAQQQGVELYAFSLQNELAFDEPYVSCVYTPQEYIDLLKVVGARFKKEKLTTKIFGPEDIGWYDRVMQYINGSINDTAARKYIDIVAVHGYASNGITPNSPDAITWQGMAAPGLKYGKPLWMTETSGYGTDFTSGMNVAKAIYTAVKWGQASGWVWWQASRNPTHDEGLWNQTARFYPPKYYMSKQYYKYVRPGAICIDAATSDAEILPLGFHHASNNNIAVVLTNTGTANKTIKLNLSNAPVSLSSNVNIYRTSATENCKKISTVNITSTITLPANSVTTIVSEKVTTEIQENILEMGFKVYPNPANDFVNVEMNLEKMHQITISLLDMTGRNVQTLISGNYQSLFKTIDISNLSKGTYLVTSMVDEVITNTKLLIIQ